MGDATYLYRKSDKERKKSSKLKRRQHKYCFNNPPVDIMVSEITQERRRTLEAERLAKLVEMDQKRRENVRQLTIIL